MSESPQRSDVLSVLMVSYELPPVGGGTGNACRHLLEELRSDPGLRVELVTSGIGNRLECDRLGETIRIHRLPVAKRSVHYWTGSELARWTWDARRYTRRLVDAGDFDVCHCWSGWPSGLIGYRHRAQIPYLVALRGSDVPGYNVRLHYLDPLVFRHVSRRVWARATVLTSVSAHLRALAHETLPDASIEVIANGVDTSYFTPGPAHDGGISILYVGRLIERKGIDHLLKAFRDLHARHDDCRLVLVGEGPERERLEAYCRLHGIHDRVSFAGVLPHPKLRTVYQRASVFVLPAIQEAMSNAMLEAMASGLPIVMTGTGGSDSIRDNGIVVEPGDDAPLRIAIERYVANPDLVRRHGRASRAVAENMTWTRAARAYSDLYLRMVGRERPTAPRMTAYGR